MQIYNEDGMRGQKDPEVKIHRIYEECKREDKKDRSTERYLVRSGKEDRVENRMTNREVDIE